MSDKLDYLSKNLRAWYRFDDAQQPGKDASGNGLDGVAMGTIQPEIQEVYGRKAAVFAGGESGTSYFTLPEKLLDGMNDQDGFSISAWVCGEHASSVWERLFDCGNGPLGPYIFLTRYLRAVCFKNQDLAADAGRLGPDHTWVHIVMNIFGTQGGTVSSAGPRVYINGELESDGFISQTSSGTYKKYREWFASLEDPNNYTKNYIGHSQFDADPDFHGALSDFRIYNRTLTEEEILGLTCEAMEPEQIVKLAKEKYLISPMNIVYSDLVLQHSLMDGMVQVEWKSDRPDVIDNMGHVTYMKEPVGVFLTAVLKCGDVVEEKTFSISVIPRSIVPCEITVHGDKPVLDISPTLFGLFFEDINHSADGGIYAEMIQNRSFEEFHFDVYDVRSGENAVSTGRVHEALKYWFGDLDKMTVCLEGGLNEYFGLEDPDANCCYIKAAAGSRLYNRGFCDNRYFCAMKLEKGAHYDFTVWAKADKPSTLRVTLLDEKEQPVSNTITYEIAGDGKWEKYLGETLRANCDVAGQILLEFSEETCIDMISLMPGNVWGAAQEESSETAHDNYLGNPNYRLRKDLVQALADMNPTFLRFPGGCISEGSFIWDNVYDWKDSVGPVEVRKENFNVWGYTMTMGLGYMEYFQLAEDLGAEPLPVMACGVLCQARSDYANPAGGALQEKYINNFLDLIDFAINTDCENNRWAKLRKEMGHEAPFGLHYLGVGNENWGTEFFASFEDFKVAIDAHMEKNYPGYELHILSTAGAQADDDAYQNGWKFLAGYQKGKETVRFTDGKESFDREVSWYPKQKNYLDTIVDEHYYRSNEYLIENADRYNYYYRPVDAKGALIEDQVSKVFVGEYASSDKNTLAGAIAEAVVMTGFERNSDVVRLAATAPLFNKVGGDGTYRWTPDAIWFDDTSVWKTPTYYVQQMFANYLGTKLLDTTYELYRHGEKVVLRPHGGVMIRGEGDVVFKKLKVVDKNGTVLFEQDFSKELDARLKPMADGKNGFTIDEEQWEDYTVQLVAEKKDENAILAVGGGLLYETIGDGHLNKASYLEYCVGDPRKGTGLRVVKDGKEGYTMGDYSSSVYAGNLRACYDEIVAPGTYTLTMDFGKTNARQLVCYYENTSGDRFAVLENKLESYIRDLYHSVTEDDKKIYIKLVNTDSFNKSCTVNFEGVKVSRVAKVVTLTGPEELVHTPNVNCKEAEPIAPVESTAYTLGDVMVARVPANSLVVVVCDKEK